MSPSRHFGSLKLLEYGGRFEVHDDGVGQAKMEDCRVDSILLNDDVNDLCSGSFNGVFVAMGRHNYDLSIACYA